MTRIFILYLCIIAIPMNAQISYIAHRGASYLAPENTESSINLAWKLKSDGAECDIMLTKDNKVILFHDKNGTRLLGKNLMIRQTKYKDLKNLPISLSENNDQQYSGSTIPLLKNILKHLPPDQLLVIEIKDERDILPHLAKVIKRHWRAGKLAFIAFDYQTIVETNSMFPHIPSYYLSSSIDDINERFESIAESSLDGVDLNHRMINSALVERFKKVNKEVWCWTVNTVEDAKKMQKAGVRFITTDRPAWLREQMDKH